jgi:sec-independent protein translocase protein TatC
MPLSGHLREARSRGARAAAALLVAIVISFLLSESILDVLRQPIERLAEDRNASLNYDSITGAFDLRLKIALFAGVVLSSPVWIYEIFAFISPGLTRREKRLTFGFSFAGIVLFLSGCTLAFFFFPHMVELLAGFASVEDSTILVAATYVDFVMKIVAATGIAFVLPVLLVLADVVGVLSAATIRKGWRVSLIGIIVFSALVTPSADVLSMFMIAVPMAALYGGAMLLTHLHDRRRDRRIARTEYAGLAG